MTLPTPNPAPDRASSARWAPRPAETALAGVGGLVLGGLGFTVDPTGRWLVWAAGLMLLGIAAMDALVRPRLQADAAGITVRSVTGRTSAPWAEVEMDLRRHQRYGRSVATLELDLDETLIVLGRRELGTDPEDVLHRLDEVRLTAG